MTNPQTSGGRTAPGRSRFEETTNRVAQGANAMGDRVQLAEHAANIGGGFRGGGGFASTGKFLGQVGDGLSLVEAQAKYMRDTRRMSADEAWVDNYGRWAIERGGGAMGGGVGATLGGAAAGALTGGAATPFGAAVGGAVGYEAGTRAAKPAADNLLPAYRGAKKIGKYTLQELQDLARLYGVLADPRFVLKQVTRPGL